MNRSAAGDDRAYVLLARHAKTDLTAGQDGLISAAAREALALVAERLRETLVSLTIVAGEDIRIGETIHGSSPIATETATLLRQRLETGGIGVGPEVGSADLDGRHASPFSPGAEGEQEAAQRFVLGRLSDVRNAGANAILVVGHQPALGIIGQNLTGGPVPLAHGAVACVKGRHDGQRFSGGRLRWTIAPSDPQTLDHLRTKIASKMHVAGLLAGLVGTGLIFVLQDLFTTDRRLDLSLGLQYLAALALFLAAALNLATVYAYDHLMMPSRFWAEPHGPFASEARRGRTIRQFPRWLAWRPPSSDALVIYQNMMRVWTWLFVPATVFMAAGVGLMGLALVRATNLGALIPWIAAEALLTVLFLAYVRSFWPVLGVED